MTQPSQPRAMKKLYALTEKRPIDLSLSENPLGCSPRVSGAFRQLQPDFNAYPSPNAWIFKKALASKFALSEKNFFVANGSESIIHDFPQIFCSVGTEVIVPALSFPLFTVSSQLAGLKVNPARMTPELAIDLSAILQALSPQTSLIFICNPNNPTGSILAKSEIIEFIKQVPKDVLLVVDEANLEFGGESVLDQVAQHQNLIVLRTLSKGHGLASLRIGFTVANQSIVQKLEEETPIFQVSQLSQQLASIELDDDGFIKQTQQFVSAQRQFLTEKLTDLGFTVFPSQANNLFVKIPSFLEVDQFLQQLKNKGISLVTGSSFKGFDDSFFRISVRDEETNRIFIEKMRAIVTEAL